jgi:hypothetical protein
MIENEPFPVKHFSLWLVLICCGIICVYVLFVALISVWVGLSHLQKDGFWMPILAGAILIILTSFLFFRLVKFIRNKMKGKDIINV